MIRLLLLGTAGCHLCEQAQQIIDDCLPNYSGLTVESIDIAEQEQWQADYAIRIPVLYHPETQKDLGWPFESAQLNAFIDGIILKSLRR